MVVRDEVVTAQGPAGGQALFARLAGSDATPTVPGGNSFAPERFFPPCPGYRFIIFSVAPEKTLTGPDAYASLRVAVPGLGGVPEDSTPGMHATNTVDVVLVLHGRVSMVLDNSQVVELEAGDTVIQNGTRHAWHNYGDTPCTMAAVLIGAERAAQPVR